MLPLSRDTLKNRSGMTIVEVLIAASIMTVVFLAVGKLSLDGMRSARNVESQADESDLRMQANVSLRDPETCLERIKTANGQSLPQAGLNEGMMKRLVSAVRAGATEGQGSLELGSIRLAQAAESQKLEPGKGFGPRVKIKTIKLVWEKAADGTLPELKTDLFAKIQVVTDRGDVAGLRNKTIELPLTLRRADNTDDSPIIGCFVGDAASTADKSPYLVVAQTSEEGHCIGTTDEPIRDCISRLPAAGGTVYIKSGTYDVQRLISLPDHTRLIGSRDAVLKFGADVRVGVSTGSKVEVEDIVFDSSSVTADNAISLLVSGSDVRIRNNRFVSETTATGRSAIGMNGGVDPTRIDISSNRFEGYAATRAGIVRSTPASGVVSGQMGFVAIENNEFFDLGAGRVPEAIAISFDATSAFSLSVKNNRMSQVKVGIQIAANLFGPVVVEGNQVDCVDGVPGPGSVNGIGGSSGVVLSDGAEGSADGDSFVDIKNNLILHCQTGINAQGNSINVVSNQLLIDRAGASLGIKVIGSGTRILSNAMRGAAFGIFHEFPERGFGRVRYNSLEMESNRLETAADRINPGGPECGRTQPDSVGICLRGGDAGVFRKLTLNRLDGYKKGVVTNLIGDANSPQGRGQVKVFRNDILVANGGNAYVDNAPGNPSSPFIGDFGNTESRLHVEASEVNYFTPRFNLGPGSTFHADGAAEVGSLSVLGTGGNVPFDCERETASRQFNPAELDPRHTVQCRDGKLLQFGGVSCPEKYAVQSSGPEQGGSGWEGRCRRLEAPLGNPTIQVWAYCCKK